MALKSTFYQDGLYYPAVVAAIDGAEEVIQVVMFLWRTDYAGDTASKEILKAIERARARGVRVLVVLNCSRFEADVARQNFATSEKLVAIGCQVRLGPQNQTIHAKIVIVDRCKAFVGSHNWTRGGLQFNREFSFFTETKALVDRAMRYFNELWYASKPFAQGTPPSNAEPITLTVVEVATEGAAVKLTFEVNETAGVDAFAALAGTRADLLGVAMGAAVSPTERLASVVPAVDAGTTIYVGVRAYSEGQAIETSRSVQLTYQPTEEPGGGDGEPGGGGGDQPPPEPLTAPTVTTVAQATPTTVTVDWTFVGAADFARFVIQQRDLELGWHEIGIVLNGSAREWAGAPNSMDSINPFRVVVYNTASQSATSNEVTLTLPTLTAPHLESVVAGLNGTEITATWTFAGCPDFHRFEIQKQVSSEWLVVGSTLDPAARQWVGPGPGEGFTEATYRVVVFNMAEESAASNEVTITGETPVPLTPPVLVSVTQIGPMGINVEYSHVTPAEFARYEVQQRTNGSWQMLGTITTPETRSWSGGPIPYMDTAHPVRVVVFVQSGDSAASNEMVITQP